MRDVDFIIVGQGLAGTCLAWELRALGASVVVIDHEAAVTASRIAAGLITPVTGQRLVKTWRWEELLSAATKFYRRRESELRCSLWRETAMVKVFVTEQEREYFERRQPDPEYAGLLRGGSPLPAGLSAPLGHCELLRGGQLDVAGFLARSREEFARGGSYVGGELSLPGDVRLSEAGGAPAESLLRRGSRHTFAAPQELHSPGVGDRTFRVELPRWGLRAGTLIFCQGIDARSNPWFANVEFNAARGEMLTIRIPGWTEERIVHGGVWIAPVVADCLENEHYLSEKQTARLTPSEPRLYRVGATYDWSNLDSGPTPEGRQSLVESLEKRLLVPYEIVDHQTAVRPILKQLNPVVGLHPRWPQLGYFNGLASKGALQAPFFARQFAAHLVSGGPLDHEVDIQKRLKSWISG